MNNTPFLQIPLSIARLVGGETKMNALDKLRLLSMDLPVSKNHPHRTVDPFVEVESPRCR